METWYIGYQMLNLNNKQFYMNYSVYNGDSYGDYQQYYFRLHDRILKKEEFFNKTNDALYLYSGIKRFIKSGSNMYLKDWSGNNRNLQLFNPVNCKSDVIFSNLALKD